MAETQLQFNYDIHLLCNGVLAGLVSVTASCAHVELWSASIIGFIGGVIFTTARKFVKRQEIDDPLDVTEIHGVCGIWSILALGIFDSDVGLIYTGDMQQMLFQLIGATAYVAWSGLLSFMLFYSLKVNKRERVSAVFETTSLDFTPQVVGQEIDLNSLERI